MSILYRHSHNLKIMRVFSTKAGSQGQTFQIGEFDSCQKTMKNANRPRTGDTDASVCPHDRAQADRTSGRSRKGRLCLVRRAWALPLLQRRPAHVSAHSSISYAVFCLKKKK